MANRYSPSAPSGWLVDENNRFVKVTDAEYQAAKNAASGSVAPTPTAPTTSATPTASSPTSTATTSGGVASAVWKEYNGVYHVVVNGKVVGTYSDPTQAQSAAKAAGNYIGSWSPQDSLGTVQEATVTASKGAAPTSPAAENIVTGEPGDYSNLPKSLTDSDSWKNLSEQQKKAVALTYTGLISGSEASKADAAKALEDAKKLADPYYKGLITLAQDELQRGIVSTSADAASRVTQLRQKIDQLNQDLAFSREDLTIEERADLAAIKRNYEVELQDTQTKMVESGLAFSSPRAEAERRLQTQTDELAQSTSRKFARQRREAELAAQRAQLAAEQDITDTERKKAESITAKSREAESKLGTQNLPGGIKQVGQPVTGTIEKSRQESILDLEKTLLGRTEPLPL